MIAACPTVPGRETHRGRHLHFFTSLAAVRAGAVKASVNALPRNSSSTTNI